jgi:hypothetical protein
MARKSDIENRPKVIMMFPVSGEGKKDLCSSLWLMFDDKDVTIDLYGKQNVHYI